jgi:uncharacterized membrane protein YdjX (TVP38/TMEM64 family)
LTVKSILTNKRLPQVLALLLVVGITLTLVLVPVDWERLKNLGYLGVFLIMLLSSSSMVLPVPGLAAVFAGGLLQLNPILLGIVGGLGSALGELTGYMAGYGGRAIVEDSRRYAQVEGWMRRYGLPTIFVLSLIPNPLFDIAGFAAGALRVPLWRFLVACAAGKILKSIIFAYAGSQSGQIIPSSWPWP